MKQMIIIGGGAAGIFAAIHCKEKCPDLQVTVLEKTRKLLAKVRISGGGRCNVTHHEFDPKKLIHNYPRGSKELLGAFFRFQPQDTIAWFKSQGVTLKTEADGRMFPTTNSSETIVRALLNAAKKLGVVIETEQGISHVEKTKSGYQLEKEDGSSTTCDYLVIATGGSPKGHALIQSLDHTITETAPSLFTFNIPASPLKELSGISLTDVEISLPELHLKQRGPLLITHFGLSGPAVLKLSAWGARELKHCHYKTAVSICWTPQADIEKALVTCKKMRPLRTFASENPFHLPASLWKTLLTKWNIPLTTPLSHIPDATLARLAQSLQADHYQIDGKTTHKEEFVTCGGVDLKEVNCTTFESKIHPGLFFVGEVLDVDGITGGFNFQNAWTSGYLVHTAIAKNSKSI